MAILATAWPAPGGETWSHEELRRFPAAEAVQGVAVDAEHFYVIANRAIGKYRKDTGEHAGGWEGESGGPILHLNAGIVIGRQLYCAHSNYPQEPSRSSVEIWDTASMKHVGRQRFEDAPGSLTWAVPWQGGWLACFAHYRPASDPALSRVIRFDADWRELASWSFPAALVERFGGYSSSGGAFGPGGRLFVTGHDAREMYVMGLPAEGESELAWLGTAKVSAPGQAFAWDESEPGLLYAIERKTREVIVSRLAAGEADGQNDQNDQNAAERSEREGGEKETRRLFPAASVGAAEAVQRIALR